MLSILDLLANVSYVIHGSICFHRSIVGISCFVSIMCVGVKCMYVTYASQILSVKFHVQLSVLFGFYVFWNSIVFIFRSLLYNLILEIYCF
jgi:hypothetical protein